VKEAETLLSGSQGAAGLAAPVSRGVEVRPFVATRYDPQRFPNVSPLLAPPYDVIDAAERQLLLARHPRNCVRLILPQPPPGGPAEGKYALAARTLRCWLCEGVLREMEDPSIFVLREDFELEERWYSRTGFIAGVRLEPLGAGPIYPHEETMGEARRDRLALLEATRANLSLVMTFFSDHVPGGGPEGMVTGILRGICQEKPVLRAVGPRGVRLTLWAVAEGEVTAKLTAAMAGRELFIADGHHRYETALAFAQEEGALGSADPQGAGFAPMQCIPLEDPGLLALPTHRLFPVELELEEGWFLKEARQYFGVEEVSSPGLGLATLREAMHQRRDEHVFGLYGRGRRAYLLSLRQEGMLDSLELPYDQEARRLDVCVFQELIVKRIFGMEFSQVAKDGTLRFVHTFLEGEQRVESDEIGLAFFVNPTPVAAIPPVARRGSVMPPKSTYFFPKVPAGLLFRLIR
jgi:uncharacterized protein (DUF1015 family)